MAKKKSITRISNKKRGRPKVRFSIWGLILIFMLSFGGCFAIYMIAANFNDNFLEEEFGKPLDEVKDNNGAADADETQKKTDIKNDADDGNARITNPIAKSEPKDSSYLGSCCLVTDQSMLDMGKYTDMKDIIGSAELSAAGCTTAVVDTLYGNNTVYEILKAKKPSCIYIMLGSDIGTSSVDSMIKSYSELVKNLKGYLQSTDIYIMQLPPVSDVEGAAVNNALINEYNTKLLNIADTNGVYCIDTNTALKGVDGTLTEGCRDSLTGLLTESAYKIIADYILCHTV